MKKLGDLWHAIRGFDEDTRYSIEHAKSYLEAEDHKHLEHLLKFRQVTIEDKPFPASARLVREVGYPTIICKSTNDEDKAFVERVNRRVHEGIWHEQLTLFAKNAPDALRSLLAPHILGMDDIKRAVILQLVMPERFHILLLGDPGTGKTDILRGAADLSPKSSFGLGSGASKVGLAVSVVGKETHEGLLVQASGGLCCIDELNLMKADDRAALYNAMEKGFITYDKGSVHQRFEADIRLLSSANPAGDQFRGSDLKTLKQQLPFDSALLSRFHLIFLVRKPDVKAFRAISSHALASDAKPLSADDKHFIQEYIKFARSKEVTVPASVQDAIVDAVTRYKRQEKQLLTDVTPRLAKGMLALAQAHARLSLRSQVEPSDVAQTLRIVEASFPKGITARS